MTKLNAAKASQLLNRAMGRAEELSINVCIALVDQGAHLVSFYRMDGAFTGSIDVAMGKARTSALFPLSTADFGDLVRQQQLTGIELTNQGLVAFPGGLPIYSGDQLIGAIGISGGSANEDADIANFALAEGDY
ncbi:MAG: heme-binding protein [Motiliproteus sp.]